MVRDCGSGINIYCVNADEIKGVLRLLKPRNAMAEGSYNIIYPAWELEIFPSDWARLVEQFDEIWGSRPLSRRLLAKASNVRSSTCRWQHRAGPVGSFRDDTLG